MVRLVRITYIRTYMKRTAVRALAARRRKNQSPVPLDLSNISITGRSLDFYYEVHLVESNRAK